MLIAAVLLLALLVALSRGSARGAGAALVAMGAATLATTHAWDALAFAAGSTLLGGRMLLARSEPRQRAVRTRAPRTRTGARQAG